MRYGRISDENLDAAIKHHSAEDIDIVRMAEDLRDLRAVLGTVMRDNWPKPTVGPHPAIGVVGVFVTGGFAMPDEAIALGAALIRTALAAKASGKVEE